MHQLLIALTLLGFFALSLAITFPQTCDFPVNYQCVGGNHTCSTSCPLPSTVKQSCQVCKYGLYCNNGLCASLATPGQTCAGPSITNPVGCYDNSKKGYAYACLPTGSSGNNAICVGDHPFSAGEGGCSTQNYDAASGGCDYGQSCNNGACSIQTNNCSIDGDCGPSSYCSGGTCKTRLGSGADCSNDLNGCAFNLIAHVPQGGSKCTCTALFSLGLGSACNDPFVCSTGFCNTSATNPTCQQAGLNAGKSCASDADCVPSVADYFPSCECSSSGTNVAKGKCTYEGLDSSERSSISALANCEAQGVDYGLRQDATHTPGDPTYYDFADGVFYGSFPHYVPGGRVDSVCGGVIRKYLISGCGAASGLQVLSALFALAIAVALLF